jgi:hypothetical protein
VSNDFDLPDAAWVRQGEHWAATNPFSTTTHSTMSYDLGDVDNDAQPKLPPWICNPMTLLSTPWPLVAGDEHYARTAPFQRPTADEQCSAGAQRQRSICQPRPGARAGAGRPNLAI